LSPVCCVRTYLSWECRTYRQQDLSQFESTQFPNVKYSTMHRVSNSFSLEDKMIKAVLSRKHCLYRTARAFALITKRSPVRNKQERSPVRNKQERSPVRIAVSTSFPIIIAVFCRAQSKSCTDFDDSWISETRMRYPCFLRSAMHSAASGYR
jgi:hypothetical protein